MARNEDDDYYHLAAMYEGEKVGLFDRIQFSGFYDRETREYHNMKMNSSLTKINFEDVTDFRNISYGGHVLGVIGLGRNHLSLGVDAHCVKLWSPVKTVDHYNYSTPTVILEKDGSQGAGTSSAGAFLQDMIRITGKLSLTAGGPS